jgi:hypothetical protein
MKRLKVAKPDGTRFLSVHKASLHAFTHTYRVSCHICQPSRTCVRQTVSPPCREWQRARHFVEHTLPRLASGPAPGSAAELVARAVAAAPLAAAVQFLAVRDGSSCSGCIPEVGPSAYRQASHPLLSVLAREWQRDDRIMRWDWSPTGLGDFCARAAPACLERCSAFSR